MTALWTARRQPRLAFVGSILVSSSLLVGLAPAAALAQAEEPGPEPWQRAEVPFTPAGLDLWDVTAGGPGFIAVGGGFGDGQEAATALVLVSPDGYTWEQAELAGTAASGDMRAITAFSDGYVAVGSGGPGLAAVWRSGDGLTWERLPDRPAFADAVMLDVAATETGLVAVGCSGSLECSGGLAWTSPDGATWNDPVALDLVPLGVASTAAGVLALGTADPYGGRAALALSTDGSAWPSATLIEANGSLHDATDLPAGILAMGGTTRESNGRSDTLALTSPDGLAWEPLGGPRVKDVWVEDIVTLPQGWLLVGWESKRGETRPATVLASGLSDVRAIAFPREVKEGGLLHAGAPGPTGETMVVVGSTVLNRGAVPTVWVRGPGLDSPT